MGRNFRRQLCRQDPADRARSHHLSVIRHPERQRLRPMGRVGSRYQCEQSGRCALFHPGRRHLCQSQRPAGAGADVESYAQAAVLIRDARLVSASMKKLLLSLLLSLVPAVAQAADSAWVQATANGYEARIVTTAAACPVLHTDKGDAALSVRAAASADFPMICAAALPAGATRATIAGTALPLPVANPQRILVLGDTGCRIKGAALQACNDPAKWPFPQVAAAAAALKPDLVIHLGDYLYRESPCPPGDAGCAGSPWGDNWTTWQADFYTPAAPLLAAAPIVLVRGNHEDCARAGSGWLRLQGPSANPDSCVPHLPVYAVDLGSLRLAVMDDASASD